MIKSKEIIDRLKKHRERYVQGAILGILTGILIFSGVPIKTMGNGNVKFKKAFYKNEKVQQVNTYEWSEILNEVKRINVPDHFNNAGSIESYNGFKTFESTSKITRGKAGWLNRASTTNQNGFQIINQRYLVAVGTHFNIQIGQYFDLVLKNGTVIPCIMGDTKADQDTDNQNIFTVNSKCMSEFIVTTSRLPGNIKSSGDVSSLMNEWNSPVSEVIIYNNIYDGTLNY